MPVHVFEADLRCEPLPFYDRFRSGPMPGHLTNGWFPSKQIHPSNLGGSADSNIRNLSNADVHPNPGSGNSRAFFLSFPLMCGTARSRTVGRRGFLEAMSARSCAAANGVCSFGYLKIPRVMVWHRMQKYRRLKPLSYGGFSTLLVHQLRKR